MIGLPLYKEISPLRTESVRPSGRNDLRSCGYTTTVRYRSCRAEAAGTDAGVETSRRIGRNRLDLLVFGEASPLRPSIRRDFGRSDLHSLETASPTRYWSFRANVLSREISPDVLEVIGMRTPGRLTISIAL